MPGKLKITTSDATAVIPPYVFPDGKTSPLLGFDLGSTSCDNLTYFKTGWSTNVLGGTKPNSARPDLTRQYLWFTVFSVR